MKRNLVTSALLSLLALLIPTSAGATKFLELKVVDKEYLMVHFRDGEVHYRDDATGPSAYLGHSFAEGDDTLLVFAPRLNPEAAVKAGDWIISSRDDKARIPVLPRGQRQPAHQRFEQARDFLCAEGLISPDLLRFFGGEEENVPFGLHEQSFQLFEALSAAEQFIRPKLTGLLSGGEIARDLPVRHRRTAAGQKQSPAPGCVLGEAAFFLFRAIGIETAQMLCQAGAAREERERAEEFRQTRAVGILLIIHGRGKATAQASLPQGREEPLSVPIQFLS